MNTIGVIPARYGSTRFPGKPLADIGGKTMVQHVYERAARARSLDTVLVATDDERIRDAVERFGGVAVMTSREHPNGTSRAAEAVSGRDAQVVVNIQGDEPFLVPEMVDELVAALKAGKGAPVATLSCRIPPERYEDPNVVKVVCDRNGFALYFSRSLIPYPRNGAGHAAYEHIGLYAYRADFLPVYAELPDTPLAESESLEQLKMLEHGYKIVVVETRADYDALSVDTEEDLALARKIATGEG